MSVQESLNTKDRHVGEREEKKISVRDGKTK